MYELKSYKEAIILAFEHSQLSKTATKMFDDILKEMREREFESVNFPLLLWGVMNSRMENSIYCALENYLYSSEEVLASEVEDNLSLMITNFEKDGDESDKKKRKPFSKKDKSDTKNDKSSKRSKKKSKNSEIPKVTTNFTFQNSEGVTITIPSDDDVVKVFEELVKIIAKFNITEIEPIHITSAMFMTDSEDFKQFFKDIDANYDDAKKHFHPDRILVCGVIPFQLAGFLSTMNDKIDGKAHCEILCRDKEVYQIWNICLKKNKRNTIIVGDPGVGKSALIEKLTHDINSGNCPEKFKKFKVIVLDVNALIAGTSYRGDAEERIKDLINFLETHHDVILFIDEVHTILGAGSCFEGEMDLANALKPILARGDTIVIGATTEEEYKKYFQKDGALSRRFEKVEVKEPLAEKVYPMIKNKLLSLTKYHGVTISHEMVDYCILVASCFAFEKKNPDKTLDLIDRAMVSATRAGKTYVDKDCVLENFGIYFEMWENMSLDTKKEVAYHEAGHYIVGKASGKLIRNNWLAVSIMPAEHYLGVTVYEDDERKVPFCNTDYYIDSIAFCLGGRVAENMFRKDFTSGASADLEQATKEAFHLVTKLGMGNDSIENRVYLNTENYPMFSEKAVNIINEEVNKVVKKSFDRATEILEVNTDILEAIVAALVEKRIMSETELDEIWKEVVANRTTVN